MQKVVHAKKLLTYPQKKNLNLGWFLSIQNFLEKVEKRTPPFWNNALSTKTPYLNLKKNEYYPKKTN